MKNKKLFALLASICLVLIFGVLPFMAACAKPAPAPAPAPAPKPAPAVHPQVSIQILGSAAGTVGHALAVALADLLNKNHPWIRATARIGVSSENIELLRREPATRKDTITWCPAITAYTAENAIAPFFTEKFPGLKMVFNPFPGIATFVTLDPNIKELKDLRGKRVALWGKAMPNHLENLAVIHAMGKDFADSLQIQLLDIAQQQKFLADGLVDAAIASAQMMPPGQLWTLSSWLEENMRNPRGHLISYPEEIVLKADKESGVPLVPVRVPAGALKEGHPAITASLNIIAWASHSDMSDELAYEIAKFSWERRADFVSYWAGAKSWLPEVVGLWPLGADYIHPGALKYFKEQGMPVGKGK